METCTEPPWPEPSRLSMYIHDFVIGMRLSAAACWQQTAIEQPSSACIQAEWPSAWEL